MLPAYRRGAEADLPGVLAIEDLSPEAARWSPQDYLEHEFWVAAVSAGVAGFLVLRRLTEGECEILNIAVAPEYRRRGIATRLLDAALQGFRGQVFLEVRESNRSARSFYATAGFEPVGRRPAYYSHPTEAAVIMKIEWGSQSSLRAEQSRERE